MQKGKRDSLLEVPALNLNFKIHAKLHKNPIRNNRKKEAQLFLKMLKPSEALSVLFFVAKILGGAAGNAISAFSLGDMDALGRIFEKDFNISKLGDAIPIVLNRIEEKETMEKINTLLSSVTHEKNVLHIDYFIFDGRTDLLLSVTKAAFEENYRFFLEELISKFREWAASRQAILASIRPSEKAQSSGISGGQSSTIPRSQQ